MYIALLISKYLRRKFAPLFAVIAVMLCTTMVIVVISVMGGFLSTMRDSLQTLSPQITIMSSWTGFPHYEELIEQLEAQPAIEAAAPVIRSAGMMSFGEDRVFVVPDIAGVDPQRMDRVTAFKSTLYWTRDKLKAESVNTDFTGDPVEQAMSFIPKQSVVPDSRDVPGMVPGIHTYPNRRNSEGGYSLAYSALHWPVTVTVLPVTRRGATLDPEKREFVVVNEFKSGVHEVDASRIYLPFDVLQRMMKMDAYEMFDMETGEPTGEMSPARTSQVLVRGVEGVPLREVGVAAAQVIAAFEAKYPDSPLLSMMTWEDQHRSLLVAVENEKNMITFLFVIISMVAVAMIAVIFYMIVLEKTRDIGVLRAIGASRMGISNMFLSYALAVGVLGGVLGIALATTIVFNLNEIQDLLYAAFGWRMWNPETYYFDQIPEQVDPYEAIIIASGAVITSVVWTLIPAYIASRVDPVESLRYE